MTYKIKEAKTIIKGNNIYREYECISKAVKKKVYCQECKKKFTRSTTFSDTINQFNKTSDGKVKTQNEVKLDLDKYCEEWNPEIKSCKDHN